MVFAGFTLFCSAVICCYSSPMAALSQGRARLDSEGVCSDTFLNLP